MATHIIDRWYPNNINTLISGDTYIIQNYTNGDWYNSTFNTTINGDDEIPGVQTIIDLSLIGSFSLIGVSLFNINFINGTITGGVETYSHNCSGINSRKYIYTNLDLSWNSSGHTGLQWDPFSFIEWRNIINNTNNGNIFYMRGSTEIPEGNFNQTKVIPSDSDQIIQAWNKEKYGQWKIYNVGFSSFSIPISDGLIVISHDEENITTVFSTEIFNMWLMDKNNDGEFNFLSISSGQSYVLQSVIKCNNILITTQSSFFEEATPSKFEKSLIISNSWTDLMPPPDEPSSPAPLVQLLNCAINKNKSYITDRYYDIVLDENNQYGWNPPELPEWNSAKEYFHKSLILVGITSPPSTGIQEEYTDAWGNIIDDIGACYFGPILSNISIIKKNNRLIIKNNIFNNYSFNSVKEIAKINEIFKKKKGPQWIY